MSSSNIKQQLYQACLDQLNAQMESMETNLQSIIESRDNETKSSVGDKYETGRAMMQQEYQKVQAQMMRVQGSKNVLANLDISKVSKKIDNGSFVETNQGSFFIAIGLGKIKLEDITYFCISLESPIGALLKNKMTGDSFSFNGRTYEITNHR